LAPVPTALPPRVEFAIDGPVLEVGFTAPTTPA